MNRYDPQRTGANLQERILTPANVNATQFGKLYSYPVDGAVYAQPLYVTNLTIGGVARNVLFVATMNDKVYAFDADRPSAAPLWMRDFTNPPSVTPVPISDIVAPDLNTVGNVGIQSTPAIDYGNLYLVARTKENGEYVQRLHALDIQTGQDRSGPVTIEASVPGNAPDATSGVITFDPKVQVQRAGIAVVNGVVLVAWASHEDVTPSHGWIMGFDASTLAPVAAFATAPDSFNAGVWQSGRAPTVDFDGNVYFVTGNGLWDGVRNFSNSVLKFSVSRGGMTLLDYFTPGNEAELTRLDDDLSGSGFTLLPGTNVLAGGGKEGVLYLLDSRNLGRKATNDTQIVQRLDLKGGHVMSGIVHWNSSAAGPLVYNWSEDDVLKSYRVSGGKLVTTPYAQGQVVSPGHPGGALTVSANGSSGGIVWASMPTNQDNIHGVAAGILRAFNAETLAQIWTSDTNASRDRLGTLMKFVPPLVMNGKVYIPNQDNEVAVYGLLPQGFTVSVSPPLRVIAPGGSGTFTVTVGAQGGFPGRVDLSVSGNPPGTSVSFSPASITGGGTSTMTVSVPANTPDTSFSITVTGTSGGDSHTTDPVLVNVNSTSGGLGSIGINFVGSGATTMASSETAGVVSHAHWNNATGAARSTPLSLVDQSGAPSGASVTWSAAGVWQLPITDGAGNRRMMIGYLDTTTTSTTIVTVTGLVERAYDVYVYADGDNRSYARGAAYTISGPDVTTTTVKLIDAASANFSGTFTRANNSNGNYLKFSITAGEFTIAAVGGTPPVTGKRRAPINAVQIVPAGATAPPPRRVVSVDFTGNSTTVMGATETAGVVSRSHWNSASGTSRTTGLALVDETGAATNATIAWTANGAWSIPITDDAGNRRMMRGYLDTSSTSTTTVTVAGLASGAYDVYVYADGDNRSYNRTASYSISGAGTSASVQLVDAAGANFSTTFTQGVNTKGNYVKFSINGTGFTLKAAPVSGDNTTLRAPINGLQIVPTGN